MNILGISAYYHDSAAAIIQNGNIIAAAQEERFTRKKHDASFPTNAVRFCLEYSGLSIDQLDAIAFYDKPWLKFERLLETYYAFAPGGVKSFIKAMPVWIKEKLFLKKLLHDHLAEVERYDKSRLKLLFPSHHLSHAASAFFASSYEKSAILTIDGVGEWATASLSYGQGNQLKVLKELHFPHSVGLLYSAFTYFLGFKVNSGEYKLMGLSPYGNPESEAVANYVRLIKENLMDLKEDGSLWLNQAYFTYATGLRMIKEKKWEALFGLTRRSPADALTQTHCDLALAIQQVTEEIVLQMARYLQKETGAENLFMAGGVALNCVANGKLQKAGIFERIFVQPAAGDAGGALGAALAAYHIYFEQERKIEADKADKMQGAYLGVAFSDLETELMAKKYQAVFQKMGQDDALYTKVAALLAEGKIVGWMQGRMEFGPRALGNRSILGDARNAEMQKKLNLNIKYRESFRPFGPSVLASDCDQYFETSEPSPYMLMVHKVKDESQKQLPDNYQALSLKEKLYYLKSDIPAVTHVDYSARIQTVHQSTNPKYWHLLEAFKAQTGYGVLVNTSFNVRGEPIVATPEDAYRCFMRTEMDYLVIGNHIFDKSDQPNWTQKDHWQEEFELD